MATRLRLRRPKATERKLQRAYTGHLASKARTVSKFTQAQVRSAFRTLEKSLKKQIPGVARTDVLGSEQITRAIRRNIGLIKDIGDEQRVALADLFVSKGTPSVSQIRETTGAIKSKAEFWATDQTLKVNAEITRERATAAGFVGYRWHTSEDERVRPEHAELDGKLFRWDSPPSVGHPGEDYRCRCIPDPVTEDEFE